MKAKSNESESTLGCICEQRFRSRPQSLNLKVAAGGKGSADGMVGWRDSGTRLFWSRVGR
jgi:hypothetical protein